jgi:hypothetical protein
VRTYTEAVQWFAAAHLIPRTACTRWDQVQGHDVRRWMVWLLAVVKALPEEDQPGQDTSSEGAPSEEQLPSQEPPENPPPQR